MFFSVHSVYIQVTRCAEAALQTTGCSTLRVRRKCRKDRKQQRKNSRIGTRVEPTIVQFAADCDKLHYPLITTTTHCGLQLRQQAWGTGARAPCSLRMHANFAAVQTMAVLIFLPSSVSSKLDRQSHQLLWQAVAKETSAVFVFADLTPDGFHFWMTLSPRTSVPVRHAPVSPWSKILATPMAASGLDRNLHTPTNRPARDVGI